MPLTVAYYIGSLTAPIGRVAGTYQRRNSHASSVQPHGVRTHAHSRNRLLRSLVPSAAMPRPKFI